MSETYLLARYCSSYELIEGYNTSRARVASPPRKKSAPVPKVDMETFGKFHGNLYDDQQTEPDAEATARHDGDDWYNEYITNGEVTTTLRKMKRGKAVGPDRIAIEESKRQRNSHSANHKDLQQNP